MMRLLLILLLAGIINLDGITQVIMVKNQSNRTVWVQIALLRVPLEPNDSVGFKKMPEGQYSLRVTFTSDQGDDCAFNKLVDSPSTIGISNRDLKRYRRFYAPEKNGMPNPGFMNFKTRY